MFGEGDVLTAFILTNRPNRHTVRVLDVSLNTMTFIKIYYLFTETFYVKKFFV